MNDKENIKVCLVGSSGGHLTHLYMLKPFWKDKNRLWVTFDKSCHKIFIKKGHINYLWNHWNFSVDKIYICGFSGYR